MFLLKSISRQVICWKVSIDMLFVEEVCYLLINTCRHIICWGLLAYYMLNSSCWVNIC
jgi:hypothetical protein